MNTRRAFTLVEILTVIAIISILVALVTLAVAGAMRAAKRARIGWEMNQIAMALEQYKNEFGEYPPDFFDDDAVVRHVKKRWPRYELPQGASNQVIAARLRNAVALVYLNQDVYHKDMRQEWTGQNTNPLEFGFTHGNADIASLAIWLGGFANEEGRFEGFSADPEAPFGRDADGNINKGASGASLNVNTLKIETPDKKVFMDMEINKNVFCFNFVSGGRPVLGLCLGTKSGSTIQPIVYFRGSSSGGNDAYYDHRLASPRIKSYNFENITSTGTAPGSAWSDCGFVVPYGKSGTYDVDLNDSTVVWNNATTYQLIHPGLDGKFGGLDANGPPIAQFFRSIGGSGSTNNLGFHDLDNITNFSDYKELQSILP